jgi:hypothetical protein
MAGVGSASGGASPGITAADEALARIRDNAFHVLELTPSCSRLDVERQGQKLLAMLELGLAAAVTYPTPVGHGTRDADKVRLAMARLRDPDKRLEDELWARLPADAKLAAAPVDEDADLGLRDLPRAPRPDLPWREALTALGWGRR